MKLARTGTVHPNGAVVYDGPSRLDGKRILAIVTGLTVKTLNEKTGDMLQVWILCADRPPVEASLTGADSSVCGQCPLRSYTAARTGKPVCYLSLIHAPRAIWSAWKRGAYPVISPADLPIRVPIRFGAYGDPGAVPSDVWRTLAGQHTGYTHQWRKRPSLRGLVMASADTPDEARAAQAKGWRTFRVRQNADDPILPSEIVCPASAEGGKKTTCARCQLCDGAQLEDGRKSIAIIAH